MVTQMNDEIELKEALDFISPASLTYEEWTMVGMGLKEAGLPVTVWEAWSARDGGRYHKGEFNTVRLTRFSDIFFKTFFVFHFI